MSGDEVQRNGILFVLSAPSGTGKSTLAHRLVAGAPNLEFSVSFTTRPPREGERDGLDYHFVDRSQFRRMVDEGAFLEWADVHGQAYGTGLAATRRVLAAGRDLLVDIDVQGARQVRAGPFPAVSVMLLPPDFATLERRLRRRASDAEGQVAGRLAAARREAEAWAEFDYVVINDEIERAHGDLASIVRAERRRTSRSFAEARCILDSFPAVGDPGAD